MLEDGQFAIGQDTEVKVTEGQSESQEEVTHEWTNYLVLVGITLGNDVVVITSKMAENIIIKMVKNNRNTSRSDTTLTIIVTM